MRTKLPGEAGKKGVLYRVMGDPGGSARYPAVNAVIMAYLGAVLVCYVLFLIAPFVTFISRTPLQHVQAYLGVTGGILLCVDLFTNKVLWRGKYVCLLYGMCLIALISSLRTATYGVKDNLFLICWTVIAFALFYSCVYRLGPEAFRKYVKCLFGVILLVWLVACCVSLYQYVFQIGYRYVVDPLSDDKSLARQGFVENRLFGIFNPLNHAVYVSFMLLVMCVYYIVTDKRPVPRAGLTLAGLVLLCHIILSGSRSAQVSLAVCVFGVAWLSLRNRMADGGARKFLVPCAGALAAVLVCALCFLGLKSGLAKVPQWCAGPREETGDVLPEAPLKEDGETREEAGILQREGLEDDVSNDRFKIWGDYLSLYSEIGLLGLSPGNYMPYIRDNYPDMYIVRYVREEFPGKYESGTIYHVHSGYLMVYVSTGLLGLLLMCAFLILCFARILRYIHAHGRLSYGFIFALAVAAAGAVSAAFDKGVFFMNNAPSFAFWLAFGAVMAEAAGERKPQPEL